MATPGQAVPGTAVPISALVTPGGAQGLGGINAFAHTTAAFTVPALLQSTTVTVDNASWMVVGQMLVIGTAGGDPSTAACLKLTAISGNTITLETVQTGSQILASSGTPGLMAQTSGNSTDYIGGDNASHNLVAAVQPTIWSARLRSFNAIGNPNFELDQRNAGAVSNLGAGAVYPMVVDRWALNKVLATGTLAASQAAGTIFVPGTNFQITSKVLNIQLTAQQASLAAGEYIQLAQSIEGPVLRELIGDVHSVSILASCTQAISFSFRLSSTASPYYCFTKLCSLAANTLTLFTIPNIPVWPSGATWLLAPGSIGYYPGICLGSGSTFIAPSDGVWNAGNYLCSPGTTNFASLPVNTLFSVVFIQHEPGPLCTQLIDKPFDENLHECLRYYQKTYPYATKPGTITLSGAKAIWQPTANAAFFAPVVYHRPIATIATGQPIIWNPQTGNQNAYSYEGAASDTAVTSIYNAGDSGYSGFSSGGAPAAGSWAYWHHTVDTGF